LVLAGPQRGRGRRAAPPYRDSADQIGGKMAMRAFGASRSGQAGFSLVEIMVGLGIGMLGVLIIMQMFLLADKQKRTTVGGADAQVTAAIALHGLERDLAQSGYGFASADLLGCTLRWTLPAGAPISTPVPLAPVVINPD